MSNCGKQCAICDFVTKTKTVKATATGKTVHINAEVNCKVKGFYVYNIKCSKPKCGMDYVGISTRPYSRRMQEHLGYIRNKNLDKATGHHFNQPGHTIAKVQMTILELCHTKDPMVLGVREQHYVKLFNAWHKGMNRNKGG